jgi:hypothetical protein
MFSIANNFTAPPVKIASERKPEYHPRTYSQFVKGLKNKELPAVIVKPSENVAQFQEENGDYGDVRIVQTEQLWQTLMDSDAEVLVDTSGPATMEVVPRFLVVPSSLVLQVQVRPSSLEPLLVSPMSPSSSVLPPTSLRCS